MSSCHSERMVKMTTTERPGWCRTLREEGTIIDDGGAYYIDEVVTYWFARIRDRLSSLANSNSFIGVRRALQREVHGSGLVSISSDKTSQSGTGTIGSDERADIRG